MKVLYHYTTKIGMNAILAANKLLPSDPLTTMDAAYGKGYYMSDLDPDKCNIAIALSCWKTVDALSKIECYLKFEVEDDMYLECRKNVFLISIWNNERIKYIEGKDLPSCSSEPCETCEKGKTIINNFNRK